MTRQLYRLSYFLVVTILDNMDIALDGSEFHFFSDVPSIDTYALTKVEDGPCAKMA